MIEIDSSHVDLSMASVTEHDPWTEMGAIGEGPMIDLGTTPG